MHNKNTISFLDFLKTAISEAEDPTGHPIVDPNLETPANDDNSNEFSFNAQNPTDKNFDDQNYDDPNQNPEEQPELQANEEDPNKQGLIRTVPKAHLVYKRKTPDDTYEELWIYNTGGSMQDELTIRRAILSGTDIPSNKTKSPDGSQKYDLWTVGNAQLLLISGLVQ